MGKRDGPRGNRLCLRVNIFAVPVVFKKIKKKKNGHTLVRLYASRGIFNISSISVHAFFESFPFISPQTISLHAKCKTNKKIAVVFVIELHNIIRHVRIRVPPAIKFRIEIS